MKRFALALLAAAGIAVTSARADHVSFRGFFSFGGPPYCPPNVFYAPRAYWPAPLPPSGYWKNVEVRVWIPGHRVVTFDEWGAPTYCWQPGHFECRTRRVWVSCEPGYEMRHRGWNPYYRG